MTRTIWRATALALTALLLTTPALAGTDEERFDLHLRIRLTDELAASLEEGDVIQLILRPEVQYGRRSVPGPPTVLETTYTGGRLETDLTFDDALLPDEIYRVEMRVVRRDRNGRAIDVRYLSALDKLPRKPVGHFIPLRLHQGHPRDARDNHVLVVRDSDDVYRVMFFTA